MSIIESRTFVIKDEAGLHARPASILCSEAGKYPGEVNITYKEKTYTLKSIMILMSLGVPQGGEITIEASGDGDLEIIEKLTKVLKDHKLV